jgi:hypothetical protein
MRARGHEWADEPPNNPSVNGRRVLGERDMLGLKAILSTARSLRLMSECPAGNRLVRRIRLVALATEKKKLAGLLFQGLTKAEAESIWKPKTMAGELYHRVGPNYPGHPERHFWDQAHTFRRPITLRIGGKNHSGVLRV